MKLIKLFVFSLLFAAHVVAAPNIIIVLVDDLGYGDLGIYGSKLNYTPNIDALARGGTRMTSAYASLLCTPSRASLMTGAYAWRVGLPRVLFPGDQDGLRSNETTIAEYMQRLGYRTGLFGKWHLGDRPQFSPLYHGFDYFAGVLYSNDMSPLPLYRNFSVIDDIDATKQQYLTGFYNSEAINFMARSANDGRPFFSIISHTRVHTPWHPLQFFLDRFPNGAYGAELGEVDWALGDMLAALQSMGQRDNTIVVFMSDNGGTRYASNAPFRGYKASTREGGVRVPMIWNWPGRIPAGVVNSKLVSVMDLLPTLVTVAGGAVPETPKIDGHNIMPLLSGRAKQSPYQAYFYFGIEHLEAVRSGDYKLELEDWKLYNLAADPGETRNIVSLNPATTAIAIKLNQYKMAMWYDLGSNFSQCGPGCRK